MESQFPVPIVPLVITTVFCAGTALYIRARLLPSSGREHLTTNYFQMIVLSLISVWSLGQLVVVVGSTPSVKRAGMTLTVAVALWQAAAWLVFALLYTGRDQWVTRRTLALLSVLPLVGTVAVVAVPEFVFVPIREGGSGAIVDFEWKLGMWALSLHDWIVSGAAIWLLFEKFLTSRNVYRKISFFHIVGGIIFCVGAALSLTGLTPFDYLLTGVTVFSVVIVVTGPTAVSYRYLQLIPVERLFSVLGKRFQNVAPMARDTIIQNMHSGVVVVDHENRIVDLNPLGRKMIGAEGKRVVGKELTAVVPPSTFETDDESFLYSETTTGDFQGVWARTEDGKKRCFDVKITALGPEEEPVGRAAVINDVTDREIRKERLERQNERLDQFAGVVSHDLRNPLNVAKGYLQTAKTVEENQEFVEEAEHSLDRMETIIEDVLTLAREGDSIGDTEVVPLEAMAREAWGNVDTDGAELVTELDHRIEADPDRLLNLFENLFRNAVEHGATNETPATGGPAEHGARGDQNPDGGGGTPEPTGPEVTVTVGWEADGFYVADDGPGIPEPEREDVMQYGYTTAEAGTGFGLAIVEQVADAHGWNVTVAESESGGAKFVFGRVTQPGSPPQG